MGIKVGKIILTGPAHCAYCGTEYEAARYGNLPYTATGVLIVLFLLAWITGRLNAFVFLLLSGLWLAFELAWEALVPLKVLEENEQTKDEIEL